MFVGDEDVRQHIKHLHTYARPHLQSVTHPATVKHISGDDCISVFFIFHFPVPFDFSRVVNFPYDSLYIE